jgi:hypothetical protein
MPTNTPAMRDPLQPTALVVPDDVREDLLRAQAESIGTPQRLPLIKIMPAAAGLFEFTDTSDTIREFTGVILGSHARNVLWDGAYGAERPESERGPACSSADGKIGVPREGFRHAGLNGPATGAERIECATCPYNGFGSKRLITESGNPRGKAVTNQRSVYVALSGRRSPMELLIVNMSIPNFDEYLNSLLQREIPVQSVLTKFSQTIQNRVGSTGRYAVATFENLGHISADQFNDVLRLRQEYMTFIRPQDPVSTVDVVDDINNHSGEVLETAAIEEDDLPF